MFIQLTRNIQSYFFFPRSKEKDIVAQKVNKTGKSKLVGDSIAKKAIALGVTTCVFDRGGYLYHGRVKAVAEAAREGGLKF